MVWSNVAYMMGLRWRMSCRTAIASAVAVLVSTCPGTCADLSGQSQTSNEGIHFFESKVRPLLAEHCFECHSAKAEKLKGELLLDNYHGLLEGGESGPAVVPGNPEESLLIRAVRYETLEMPPKQKLSKRQIEILTQWVALGAPWPATDQGKLTLRHNQFELTAEDRKYWAYQPIQFPRLPAIPDVRPVNNPIDHFVLAKLAERGIAQNERASGRVLCRRVHFVVTGLPPTPEFVDGYIADRSPDKYERLVDRLLSSPLYGQRWGRHWLDVVRYGQTNGYERDDEKPFAWRYRDYVIDAFNADLSYDKFIRQQLAGDELDHSDERALIATGFYRLGVWDDEPDDRRAAEFDGLDDILSTIGVVFMGQTIGCARCHDHMFDPISQMDYYELLAFIRNVRHYENPKYSADSATFIELEPRAGFDKWKKRHEQRIAEIQGRLAATGSAEQKKALKRKLDHVQNDQGIHLRRWALGVREYGSESKPTHLLVRGNAATPGPQVEPRFLHVMGNKKPQPVSFTKSNSSGRRRQLAEWIASREHPLTARTIVNRLWQHHFGRGICRSPNDLGKAGVPPTHPRLIDWLAAELVENQWSIKWLQRKILLSRTFQMSSRWEAAADEIDPGNDYFWRQNLRRLDAESIRDSILAISGTLNLQMGGRGFFPALSSEILDGQSKPGWGWDVSPEAQTHRRSVYIFLKRGVREPITEAFDYVNTASPIGARPTTTVAPQALIMLNSDLLRKQARALAVRIASEAGPNEENQVNRLYQVVLNRLPTVSEGETAIRYMQRQREAAKPMATQLVFRPDVPRTIREEYRRLLSPERYIIGPRAGWSYYSGKWVGGYEDVKGMVLDRAPFVLWTQHRFRDGVVTGRMKLSRSTEFASLLLRATVEENHNVFRGWEVRLLPNKNSVELRLHGDEDKPVQVIERASVANVVLSEWFDFQVHTESDCVRFVVGNHQQLIDQQHDGCNQPGFFGVTTVSSRLLLDNLCVESAEGIYNVKRVTDGLALRLGWQQSVDPALQALCVVMLNLNEFVYLD